MNSADLRVEPAASWRSRMVGALILAGLAVCLALSFSPAPSLLLGAAFALTIGNPFAKLTSRASQWLLKAAVVGLGAGINLGVVLTLGLRSFWYTLAGIAASVALGLWLSQRLKLERELAVLITAGTAICGGSAIAAVAGAIKPKAQATTVALVAVFLLNAAALVIFPPLGHALGFSPAEFGTWAALAIHDTSSVVGAAIAYDPGAVEVATTTKLVRALWIAPLVVGLGWWWQRGGTSETAKTRFRIPGFILGFLAAAAIFSYIPSLAEWGGEVAAVARRLFTATLFLIGLGFSREALRTIGLRPVIFSIALWVVITAATAIGVLTGWIA